MSLNLSEEVFASHQETASADPKLLETLQATRDGLENAQNDKLDLQNDIQRELLLRAISEAETKAARDAAIESFLSFTGISDDGSDPDLNAAKAESLAEDTDATDQVGHRLTALAELLPDNPRRVKRLINMISVYQISAQSTLGLDADTDPRWQGLALWILLMTEQPDAWILLCDEPKLVDLEKTDQKLPLSLKRADVRKILDHGIAKDASDRTGAWLTRETVSDFARLTPAPPPKRSTV